MVSRNAAVTHPVTPMSRSSHSERLETRDKRREEVRNEGLRAAARGSQEDRRRRAEEPLNGGDAAILWATYSPYPAEAGIAGRRYKQLAPHYTDPWALLMAVCEAAFEGHHAAGSCRGDYLRSRAARIRETVYFEEKSERETDPRRDRGLHRAAFSMAAFGLEAK